MYRNSTIGVVVPAYNEEGFVGDVLRGIPDYVDRIYVVNDSSTDDTWAEILEASRDDVRVAQTDDSALQYRDSRIDERADFIGETEVSPSTVRLFEDRVREYQFRGDFIAIDHTENFGAGGSIKTGYLAALIDGVDVVVTIDADGQMDPSIMDRLIDPVVDGTAEYAKGTRLLNREHRREMPWIRRFGNNSLTYLTKIASGYWDVTDSQNGYTAISRSTLRRIGIEDLFEYYAYCNAVLVRLNVHDTPIADVEVPTSYGDETSDIEYSKFIFKVTPMLVRKFLWRLWQKYVVRETKPIAFLYGVGGVGLLLGAIIALTLRSSGTEDQYSRYSLLWGLGGGLSVAIALALERSASSDLVEVIQFEGSDETADRVPTVVSD